MEPMEAVEAIYNVHHGEIGETDETPVDAQSSNGETAAHMPDMEAIDQVQNGEIGESFVDVHSLNADTATQMFDASIFENAVGEVLVSVWTEPMTWREYRAPTYKNIWNRNNMLMLEPPQHQNDVNRVPVVYDEWDECKKFANQRNVLLFMNIFAL